MTVTVAELPEALSDPGYASLKAFVLEVTGLAYYADKDEDFAHRIEKRRALAGRPDCAAYLDYLKSPDGATELDRLVEELTVGETSFFRHAELFAGMRDIVLPDLFARGRAQGRLRIWSAGASIGAEAYSIAIMLAPHIERELCGVEVTILGTDINRAFLARAHRGAYRAWDFRGASAEDIADCFDACGDEWIIRPEYRRRVFFQYHNLVRDPFPCPLTNLCDFDLILCRNVLMYFAPAVVERLVSQFYRSLNEGGWFLVGHAETNVSLFRAFRTLNTPGAVLYQRAAGPLQEAGPATALDPVKVTLPPRQRKSAAPGGEARARERAAPPPLIDPLALVRRIADGGDLRGARRACRRFIEADPLNPELHLQHAMLLEQLTDHAGAERALRRTLYLDPGNCLAHFLRGLLQKRRGCPADAIRSFRNVLEAAAPPDGAPVRLGDGLTHGELRAMACMHLSRLERA